MQNKIRKCSQDGTAQPAQNIDELIAVFASEHKIPFEEVRLTDLEDVVKEWFYERASDAYYDKGGKISDESQKELDQMWEQLRASLVANGGIKVFEMA